MGDSLSQLSTYTRRSKYSSSKNILIIGWPKQLAQIFFGNSNRPVFFHDINKIKIQTITQNKIKYFRHLISYDRVLQTLHEKEACSFLSSLKSNLEVQIKILKPKLIISGFDGAVSKISFDLAKENKISWYALYFSTIPNGLMAFCPNLEPFNFFNLNYLPKSKRNKLSKNCVSCIIKNKTKIYSNFERGVSGLQILLFIPRQLLSFLYRQVLFNFKNNKFLIYSPKTCVKIFLKKINNFFQNKKINLLLEPPKTNYCIYGFHMQPESSIDTWGNKYRNQIKFVLNLKKHLPNNFDLCVKLHKADPNRFSISDLRMLIRKKIYLASPNANTNLFIDNCSFVIGIHGTMCLEGSLKNKPVIMFGRSYFQGLPNVIFCPSFKNLKKIIKNYLLKGSKKNLKITIQKFSKILKPFGPAKRNYNFNEKFNNADILRVQKTVNLFFNKLHEIN